MTAPLVHRLVAPETNDAAMGRAILEGRYELPRVPDLVRARRILDIGAGVGAFAAWCHYLWPHAWIDCYEPNESRAGYCQQNAPPGTAVHMTSPFGESYAAMPAAEVVRVADGSASEFFDHYPHARGVRVFILEWMTQAEFDIASQCAEYLGLRLAQARVDHLGRGCAVWIDSKAEFEPATEEHIVLGDHALLAKPLAQPPTFVLGIPHTPWVPERVASLAQLLEVAESSPPTRWGCLERKLFQEREPNHVWSARMWHWAFESDASHFVTLQDDARVAPNFWPVLQAMVSAVPHEIIGLEAVHPAGPFLASRGQRWYSTCAWLIGVAYVIPRRVLGEFLAWRQMQPAWRITGTNEDTLINDWCGETRRRVLHPVPTIVDHDVEIPSTYDNDADTHRRPTVRWTDGKKYGFALEDLEQREFWAQGDATRLELPTEAK